MIRKIPDWIWKPYVYCIWMPYYKIKCLLKKSPGKVAFGKTAGKPPIN